MPMMPSLASQKVAYRSHRAPFFSNFLKTAHCLLGNFLGKNIGFDSPIATLQKRTEEFTNRYKEYYAITEI